MQIIGKWLAPLWNLQRSTVNGFLGLGVSTVSLLFGKLWLPDSLGSPAPAPSSDLLASEASLGLSDSSVSRCEWEWCLIHLCTHHCLAESLHRRRPQ